MSKDYPYAKGYCEMLIEFLGKGQSFDNFGGEIKVPMRFVNRWIKTEPDFRDAHEIGMAQYRSYWEKIEMASKVGGTRRARKSDSD